MATLDEKYFSSFHKFGVDWKPGEYVRWYIDVQMVYGEAPLGRCTWIGVLVWLGGMQWPQEPLTRPPQQGCTLAGALLPGLLRASITLALLEPRWALFGRGQQPWRHPPNPGSTPPHGSSLPSIHSSEGRCAAIRRAPAPAPHPAEVTKEALRAQTNSSGYTTHECLIPVEAMAINFNFALSGGWVWSGGMGGGSAG